ncbi:hypothetical protein Q3G72_023549 [Acer saccharum]|nr:hypothetical protein Q3G72_023549 [Acer saccharum]
MQFGELCVEPLLVEEDTVLWKRLDRGGFLTLVPNSREVLKFVNVTIGKEVYSAVVEEDEQVSHHWLSSLLRLVECKSGLNQEGTCFDANQWKVDSSTRVSNGFDKMEARNCHDRHKVGVKPARKSFRFDKGESKKDRLGVSFRLGRKEYHKVGKSGFLTWKIEVFWFRNQVSKKEDQKKGRGGYHRTLEGSVAHLWPNTIPISNISIDLRNSSGRSSKGPSSISESASSEPTLKGHGSLMLDHEYNSGTETVFNEGLIVVDPTSHSGTSSNGDQRTAEDVPSMIAPSVSTPVLPKSKRGGKKKGAPKSHLMQTRWSDGINQGNGVDKEKSITEKWNLEVEVAKMIEEGYARGFFFKAKYGWNIWQQD